MGGLGLGPRRGTGHGHQQQVGEIGLRTGTEVGFYKGGYGLVQTRTTLQFFGTVDALGRDANTPSFLHGQN